MPTIPKEETEVIVIAIAGAVKTDYTADPESVHGPWLDGLFAIDVDDTDGDFNGAELTAQFKLMQASSFKDEPDGRLAFTEANKNLGYQEFEMTGYLNIHVETPGAATDLKVYLKRIKNR